MTAPPNDSNLDRSTVAYIVALRKQLSGNTLKLLWSFCQASVKFLSNFCEVSVKLLYSSQNKFVRMLLPQSLGFVVVYK